MRSIISFDFPQRILLHSFKRHWRTLVSGNGGQKRVRPFIFPQLASAKNDPRVVRWLALRVFATSRGIQFMRSPVEVNASTVLEFAQQQGVQMFDLRFSDLHGLWHHISYPIGKLTVDSFREGF